MPCQSNRPFEKMGIEGYGGLGHGTAITQKHRAFDSNRLERIIPAAVLEPELLVKSPLGRMMTIKIAIAGAAGRMGQQLIQATKTHEGAAYHGGFDRTANPNQSIFDEIDTAFKGADVVIDFTFARRHGPYYGCV